MCEIFSYYTSEYNLLCSSLMGNGFTKIDPYMSDKVCPQTYVDLTEVGTMSTSCNTKRPAASHRMKSRKRHTTPGQPKRRPLWGRLLQYSIDIRDNYARLRRKTLRNATVFPRKGTASNTAVLFRTVIRCK